MPAEGVQLTPAPDILTASEIIRLARIFVSQGVTKIRLTGGEPTVRKDLLDIVAGLNELRPLGLKAIGMTTNGVALKRKLPSLLQSGMDNLNVSLDTLDKLKFELMTRRRGFDNVIESIHTAVSLGYPSVKLNSVVINKVNDDELVNFVKMTKDLPVYVRFIEYMPFGGEELDVAFGCGCGKELTYEVSEGNKWNGDKFIPYKEMLERIKVVYPDARKVSDEPNDTSKAYMVPGFRGKFGFITSMSDHFCGSCNRLRVLADGNMKVCLFGNKEVNLRDALRSQASDEELLDIIGAAVKRKKKQHA
ncbi:Molybdenum cofactor synthesis protein 1, partial [Borealophlyctis nickersoniae]